MLRWDTESLGFHLFAVPIFGFSVSGTPEDEILNDFPDLARSDIPAALGFAAAREQRLTNSVT